MTHSEFAKLLNAVDSEEKLQALAEAVRMAGNDVLMPSGLLAYWRGTWRELRATVRGIWQEQARYWRDMAAQDGIYAPGCGGACDLSAEACSSMAGQWDELAAQIGF